MSLARLLLTISGGARLQKYPHITSVASLYVHPFCTNVPHLEENNFSHIELETKQKILEARKKDMPLPSLENPFQHEKVSCILCQLDIHPDYKNIRLLSQFISPYTGRIYGRHITGLCKQKQMLVEQEIVKAQNCGLMGTMLKDVTFLKDPKLFNPEKPIRPHRF